MSEKQLHDIIEWDVVNWSKGLDYFASTGYDFHEKYSLAIGERHGGLSLWMALNGANVVSTDLNGVSEEAKRKHIRYGVDKKITYREANILSLDFPSSTFDVVMFKSVIGALGKEQLQQQAINEIRRVLKPGGVLFFAENLVSSPIHGWLRKKFINWAGYWRYITVKEASGFCSEFSSFAFSSAGFLGTPGRSESQRRFLGIADTVVEKIVPRRFHYVIFVAAVK